MSKEDTNKLTTSNNFSAKIIVEYKIVLIDHSWLKYLINAITSKHNKTFDIFSK